MAGEERTNSVTTLRKLVEEGRTDAALDMAHAFFQARLSGIDRERARHLLNSVAILRARAQRNVITKIQGTASPTEIEAEQARFELATLRLIDEVQRISSQPMVNPVFDFANDVVAEKLMTSESHLRSVGWLAKGLNLSSAVCRLTNGRTYASGFRCGLAALLTNNHVIPNEAAAKTFRGEFLFEDDGAGNLKTPISITLNPQRHFWTSQELDVTLVGLAETPPVLIATVSMRQNLTVKVNEHVSIIQHPEGGPKQMAVTNNRVLNIFDPFVHYFTDTMSGSSGSPVFSDSWEVVAIHRAGGNVRRNAAGDVIFANEGVLTSALMKHEDFCASLRNCEGTNGTS